MRLGGKRGPLHRRSTELDDRRCPRPPGRLRDPEAGELVWIPRNVTPLLFRMPVLVFRQAQDFTL